MKILKNIYTEQPPGVKLLIIAGTSFVSYRLIKKLINKPKREKLPQGGAGLPVVSTNTDGTPIYWNPAPMAAELFNVMDGLFTGSATKDATFTKLAQIPSNDMLTAVYNYFNSKYGDGKSLTTWIKDEWFTDITGSGKELALQKLEIAGLK